LISINWTTSSEINNNYFLVERSEDAATWEIVSKVSGAGYGNAILSYTTTDKLTKKGTYYYRLTQVDYDGTMEVFNPVAMSYNGNLFGPSINIYPNPATDYMVLSVPNSSDESLTVEILNLSGQVIYSHNIQATEGSEMRIDLTGFESGIFVIKCYGTTLNRSSKLVIRK
jgi:hypothetical protein